MRRITVRRYTQEGDEVETVEVRYGAHSSEVVFVPVGGRADIELDRPQVTVSAARAGVE